MRLEAQHLQVRLQGPCKELAGRSPARSLKGCVASLQYRRPGRPASHTRAVRWGPHHARRTQAD
eukprot:3276044-Pyramimonas_sp.AAC.1